ncbi:MAG: hypothetical protein JO054_05505 [Actinobacteria bacterium]|nr:hypothetical protein [Actinomycetota bacterium]MBV9253665.1 hypothetical protein [Actinomycetota bacterium]
MAVSRNRSRHHQPAAADPTEVDGRAQGRRWLAEQVAWEKVLERVRQRAADSTL